MRHPAVEEKDRDGGTQPSTPAGGEVAFPARPAANFLLKHPLGAGTPWAHTRKPRALSTEQVRS